MIRLAWKSLICGLMAAAVALPAAADDLDELNARLDAIEAENAKLREDLSAMQTSDDALEGQMSALSHTVDKKEDAKGPGNEDPQAFSSKWSNGWEATTQDKQFKYHVGGRVQVDAVFLENNPGGLAGAGGWALRTPSTSAALDCGPMGRCTARSTGVLSTISSIA